MLHFEGDRDFPLSPVDLWGKLRDARFLVTCIPDATIKGEPQRDRAEGLQQVMVELAAHPFHDRE